jgi:hypothetical protein
MGKSLPLVNHLISFLKNDLLSWIGFVSAAFMVLPLLFYTNIVFFTISSVVLGVIIGAVAGYFIEQRQLRRLQEEGEIKTVKHSPKLSTWLMVIGVVLILLGATSLIVLSIPNSVWDSPWFTLTLFMFMCTFYPIIPVYYGIRIFFVKRWQRKKQK